MEDQNNVNVNLGATPTGGSSAGLIVAIVVILALIALGGLYFWNQSAVDQELMNDESFEAINTQSSSDETSSIEADLNSTNVDNLDAELNAS